MKINWDNYEKPEKAEEAGRMLEELIDDFSCMKLNPDFAAYLMLSAGMCLLTTSNRQSPLVVSHILATAMMSATMSILSHEEDQETKH